MLISKGRGRLAGCRLCLPLLVAGAMFFSPVARGDANEDYQTGLGHYQNGDVVSALPPLRKAATAGHVKGMVLLASILDYTEYDDEAIELYRKTAAQGDPEGMFGLGTMLAAGEGVSKKDPVEARRWILKSAELGNSQAIKVIAQAYLRSELGIAEEERNTAQALHWVQLAAGHDDLPSLDALVQAYRAGGMLGVAAPDAALSAQYLAQANKIRGIEAVKKRRGKK